MEQRRIVVEMPGVALDRAAMSGIEALRRSLKKEGMRLVLRNLSADQAALLHIAGYFRFYLPDGHTMESGDEAAPERESVWGSFWSLARGLPVKSMS